MADAPSPSSPTLASDAAQAVADVQKVAEEVERLAPAPAAAPPAAKAATAPSPTPAAPAPAAPAAAAPPAVATAVSDVETAVLALKGPFQVTRFLTRVEGWGAITRDGVKGPAATVDQVIAAAAKYGVRLERR